MNERQKLLRIIQINCFILNDLGLYLDTHPRDQRALEYFKQHQQLKNKAVAEYITKFGPLQMDQFPGGDKWTWIDNPWPWHMEKEV